jgi:hypothetical protein
MAPTSYTLKAWRDGRWWTLTVAEVPGALIQVRRLAEALRVWSMAWSPSGVLDATMYDCADSTSNTLPMEFWEDTGGKWSQLTPNLLYAARGPDGVVASVSGDLTEQGQYGPNDVPSGTQKLVIANLPVALSSPAEEVVWAP